MQPKLLLFCLSGIGKSERKIEKKAEGEVRKLRRCS